MNPNDPYPGLFDTMKRVSQTIFENTVRAPSQPPASREHPMTTSQTGDLSNSPSAQLYCALALSTGGVQPSAERVRKMVQFRHDVGLYLDLNEQFQTVTMRQLLDAVQHLEREAPGLLDFEPVAGSLLYAAIVGGNYDPAHAPNGFIKTEQEWNLVARALLRRVLAGNPLFSLTSFRLEAPLGPGSQRLLGRWTTNSSGEGENPTAILPDTEYIGFQAELIREALVTQMLTFARENAKLVEPEYLANQSAPVSLHGLVLELWRRVRGSAVEASSALMPWIVMPLQTAVRFGLFDEATQRPEHGAQVNTLRIQTLAGVPLRVAVHVDTKTKDNELLMGWSRHDGSDASVWWYLSDGLSFGSPGGERDSRTITTATHFQGAPKDLVRILLPAY